MHRLAYAAGFDHLAKPFVTFVGIDSETDTVPVGKARDLWHPDAIERHAAAWAHSEAWAKEVGESACHDALELVRHSLV